MIREELIGRQFRTAMGIDSTIHTICRSGNPDYYLIKYLDYVYYNSFITEAIEQQISFPAENTNRAIDNGEWVLLPIPIVDYTVPGTPIPTLPEGTEYRVVLWSFGTGRFRSFSGSQTNFVSYGSYIFDGIDCILCEIAGHVNVRTKYIIKLADIQALTPIQPIIEAEFVLPQQWHCIVTAENQEALSQWRYGSASSRALPIGYLTGITKAFNGTGYEKGHNQRIHIGGPNEVYDFGIEITYEQFKKYVLKTDNNKQLTCNDLKEGDYVYEEYPYGGGTFISVVNLNQGNANAQYFIDVDSSTPRLNRNSIFSNTNKPSIFRYATQEEIDWLNACIANNAFVSKEVALAGLSKKSNEKELFSELEVIDPAKGFSMSQFAKALESIPWMEKDDAKDIYKEVEKHFKSIKIEEEVIT